jgi:single-strand DNA-binding protein
MINRVVLVGRLTRDPELRYTTNNIANLRFTVAVNRQFSNQNGERQADFISCVAWRAQAENMARFLKKGSLVGVEGRIETGSYQGQDGQMRYTTDVIADSVQFLEPRSAQGSSAQPGFGGNDGFSSFPTGGVPPQQSNPFPSENNGMAANPFPSNAGNNNNAPDFNSTIDISDDDLPF